MSWHRRDAILGHLRADILAHIRHDISRLRLVVGCKSSRQSGASLVVGCKSNSRVQGGSWLAAVGRTGLFFVLYENETNAQHPCDDFASGMTRSLLCV